MAERVKADEETLSVIGNPKVVEKAELDAHAKRMLSLAPIIAMILKKSIPELKDYDVEVLKNAIKIRDDVAVSPDLTVSSRAKVSTNLNVESKVIDEKTLYFDKLIEVEIEELGVLIVKLIVDYEVQGTVKLPYPVEYRGIYYLARNISSQLNYVNEDTVEYDKLKKVYSIWICLNDIEDDEQNSIVSYSFKSERLYGNDFNIPSADLMELIIVKLGNVEATNLNSELVRLLYGIFHLTTHKHYFDEFIDDEIIKKEPLLRKELETMSGVGLAVYNSGCNDTLKKYINYHLNEGVEESEIISGLVNVFGLDYETAETLVLQSR